MIPREKTELILQRFAFLEAKLGSGVSGEVLVDLSREYAELKPVVAEVTAYNDLQLAIDEAQTLVKDPEMRAMAQDELEALRARLPAAEAAVKLALLPKNAADTRPAILEIRAGTGGDEAALFAAELKRMYQRLAERRGWSFEVLELAQTELGGIRELVAIIKGEGVFSQLKFESGVHRVQRVPQTESGGRIHTSAATVAVLPEAAEFELDIPQGDIRIDTMRASGAGGQHVNTTDSAVRITHIPSGIVVTSSEKSQHQNRARAMQVLRTRLFDLERQKRDASRAAERKGQVGSGDRSERIRTYNFPQGRVTDHRINLTLYRLEQVLQGDLDELIDALIASDQADRLAELDL